MKRILFLCMIFGIFWSCGDEASRLKDDIADLEAQLEESATKEIADQLLEKYDAYITQNPTDKEHNARLRYRSAGVLYRMNRGESAIEQLRQVLIEYPESDNTFNTAFLLASVYSENHNQKHIANTIFQSLKERDITDEQHARIDENLQEGLPPIEGRLNVLQAAIFDDSTGSIQYRYANEFIMSSEYYGLLLPDREKMPDLLLRAAETARTIRSFPKALELYERITERYPDHPKASQALFLRAFTLDNDVKDLENARRLYEEFLEKYPDNEFADDTEFLLKNLGKDDQEIIESFQSTE